MDYTVYWFMFPACIVIATVAMTSGISGAALLSPVLILGFPLMGVPKLSPASAIGMSLFTEFFGFGSGFVAYYRRRLIDFHTYRALVMVAVPVTVAAAFVSRSIDARFLKLVYGILMFGLAYLLVRQAPETARPGADSASAKMDPPDRPDREETVVTATDGTVYRYRVCNRRIGRVLTAFGAAVSGLISTGLGEVEMPQLVKRCHVPVPVAAGTSIAIITSTVLAASLAHIFQIMRESGIDAVPWNLVVYTVPGALIGGQIGGRLQGRLDEEKFERFMGALFGVIGVLFIANVLTG